MCLSSEGYTNLSGLTNITRVSFGISILFPTLASATVPADVKTQTHFSMGYLYGVIAEVSPSRRVLETEAIRCRSRHPLRYHPYSAAERPRSVSVVYFRHRDALGSEQEIIVILKD